MEFVTMLQTVQIPLLAAMLLGGCVTKLIRAVRLGSLDRGLGPTALFPMRLRRPIGLAMSALELGLGLGLIVTAGAIGRGAPATCVRLGTGLLFLVATSALLELRAARPDAGCGCFGDFSHTPVGGRTLTRSALLAAGALITIGLRPVQQPQSSPAAALLLGMLAAELAVIAGLSPELGEALVRLGYSEPCELRIVPAERTLTALRRSKQWRRHAGLLTADMPADVWRELCWRYLVFPARYGDREAEIVFAVFLRQRRPLIHAAIVDAATGTSLPWAAAPSRVHWPGRRGGGARRPWSAAPGQAPAGGEPAPGRASPVGAPSPASAGSPARPPGPADPGRRSAALY
jgi:hypothetical protein